MGSEMCIRDRPSTATAALAFFAVLRAAAFAPPHTRLHPRARRPTHVRAGGGDDAKPDVIDEFFPRFRRDGAAAAADEAPAAPTGAARMNTVNAKLLADIEKSKSQFRVEAPQVEEREDVDVSDVSPVRAVLSGVAALGAAYVFWLGVGFTSDAFDAKPLESEFYPVMRISMIMRTVVLGAGTLLTGITGFAGVGLIALGAKVAVAPDAQIRDDGDDVVLPSEAARDAVDE